MAKIVEEGGFFGRGAIVRMDDGTVYTVMASDMEGHLLIISETVDPSRPMIKRFVADEDAIKAMMLAGTIWNSDDQGRLYEGAA